MLDQELFDFSLLTAFLLVFYLGHDPSFQQNDRFTENLATTRSIKKFESVIEIESDYKRTSSELTALLPMPL